MAAGGRWLAAAGLLGACHAAAFAPWPAWWLQLLCLALGLRLVLAAAARSALRAALTAFFFGLGHFALGLCWLHISMHRYGGMPWLLAALAVLLFAAYLALFPAAAIALAGAVGRPVGPVPHPGAPPVSRRVFGAPLAWAGALAAAWALAELARGWLFTGFPWLAVGYAHVEGPLAGLAPILGVYGVGMVAVWVAALLAWALMLAAAAPRDAARWVGLATLTLLLGWSLQGLHFTMPAGPPVSVRLVQGNVPQQLKFDPSRTLAAMQHYAQQVAQSPATLTILPETAWTMPWASTPAAIANTLAQRLRGTPGALAIGMPMIDPDASGRRITNSVLLLTDGPAGLTTAGRYDKHHLVPFGEFIPWGFDWFVQLMRIPLGSFARGETTQQPFAVGGQRFALNICYEDLFGEEIIEAVREPAGATVLVNVSNIAWFGDSHALTQHREIARMRALETGRPMLRATNTGVTASIDHRAQVLAQLPHLQAGALDTTVQGTAGLTPYVQAGNLPVMVLALLVLVAARRWQRAGAPIQ